MNQIRWPAFLYGGDYNPDQWPREMWAEDIALMKKAGWNVATLPVFGWAALERSEGEYTFDWLQEVLDQLHEGGIKVCFATATASVPAWLTQKYPEVLVTEQNGRQRKHGTRHLFCPSSPAYQRLSTTLVRRLAEKFANHPSLVMWHINNEYGNRCWCDLCAAAFRVWLQERYGSLERLNHAWNTAFWGHTFTDWSQVDPSYEHGETAIHALEVDYQRFQSRALANLCRAEIQVIREFSDLPVTTNFMGIYPNLDYRDWAKELDVISWDSYPDYDTKPADVAFMHSQMRGLKDGQSFLLMESSPSQMNWTNYSRLKAPGRLRALSYQAIAHGADSVMYFQWRKSPGGFEKYHGAVVEHGGDENNRIFREVAQLGAELAQLGTAIQGGKVPAKVALVFDWSNRWALAAGSGPSRSLDYVSVCLDFFRAFHNLGIAVEVVAPDRQDWSSFDIILAPLLNMLQEDHASRIAGQVAKGATLVGTSYTGLVDENDRVRFEGAPGPWKSIFGLHVEETDALPPDLPNQMVWPDGFTGGVRLLADRVRLNGAKILATYGDNWYKGEAALLANGYGSGQGVYLAGIPDDAALARIVSDLVAHHQLTSPLGGPKPEALEVSERLAGSGENHLYLINHSEEEVQVALPPGSHRDLLADQMVEGQIAIEPWGVRVLTQRSRP